MTTALSELAPPTTPPQRLADTIIEQRNLNPPVPVEDLVAELADVRAARLRETGLDALLHGLHGNDRPTLLIREDAPPTRTRFTLGHELGHLCMAWHQGTLSCAVGGHEPAEHASTPLGSIDYEREADQFASRLLVPVRYLDTFDPEDVPALLSGVETTEISAEAAIYALSAYLGPGYTFVILDSFGRTPMHVARSRGTVNLTIPHARRLNESHLANFMQAQGHHKYRGSSIFWGRHEVGMTLIPSPDDWRTVLRAVLADSGFDSTGSGSVWLSVNGVAAAAHGAVGHDDQSLLAARIKQSFMRHERYASLVAHPRFDEYVSCRARDFASK